MLAGCGDAYRATVGTGNPVPVPTQPEYLPVVISNQTSSVACAPNSSTAGCANNGAGVIYDAAGDTELASQTIGTQPVALALGSNGGIAYVVNLGSFDAASGAAGEYQGSISQFSVVTSPMQGQVNTSTLDSAGDVFLPYNQTPSSSPCDASVPPEPVPAVFANSNLIYVSQNTAPTLLPLSRNVSGTGVPSLIGTLAVDGVITNFTGLTSGLITYAIESQNNEVQVLDSTLASATTSPVIKASITSGFSQPTYGVTSPDGNRIFVLNCGGFVTAINGQTYSVISQIPIPVASGQSTAGVPVWADFVNNQNLLVTVNTTSPNTTGVAPTQGSLTVINSVEDTSQFGAVEGTIPVGANPSMVAVLQESTGTTTRAYVANDGDNNQTPIVQGSVTEPCNCKTVSVVPFGINGTPQASAFTIPLYYSQVSTTGVTTTISCPAYADGNGVPAPSATGSPLEVVATPDTVDQQVFVLCNQPSEDGSYYLFAIRTFSVAGTAGGTSPGDTVVAAIPVDGGVPSQLRVTPAR